MKVCKAYTNFDYTPVPTEFSKFMRKCVVWQLVRFAIINIKMLIVVSKSH